MKREWFLSKLAALVLNSTGWQTMRDITGKQITLRTAQAIAFVKCSDDTLDLILQDRLPKGNLLDVAKAAGFLAAKNTHNLIPHCHPVSIDGLSITYQVKKSHESSSFLADEYQKTAGVLVIVEGKSIGRTGIEMEALTAASVAALTIYDLLKPLGQKDIEITSVRLLEKTGGKSDKEKYLKSTKKTAILVCSDSAADGRREDKSGKLIQEMLYKNNCDVIDYQIIPDEKQLIQEKIREWVAMGISFIFTTGGTGLSPRDNTVDAVSEIIEKDAPGISEAMRVYGGMRTPLAMMSRCVAGSIGETLIITLPGSTNGARESLEAILPSVFHAKSMLRGGAH